ncbi:MAG TPA: hypothetical protein VK506_05335 [Conexibacter sp.]|nr:hypothetical protein [Conexibacter sp.]
MMRLATSADVDHVLTLRRNRAAWLRERGLDQWSRRALGWAQYRQRVLASIERRQTWLGIDAAGAVLGTVAVTPPADDPSAVAGLWTASEIVSAVVVQRMMAADDARGAALLHHVDRVAAARAARWTLLDVWTGNITLQRLYERHGYEHVRTVPGRASGALFRRAVSGA